MHFNHISLQNLIDNFRINYRIVNYPTEDIYTYHIKFERETNLELDTIFHTKLAKKKESYFDIKVKKGAQLEGLKK